MKCNMNQRDSYKPEHMPEKDEYKYYPHPKPEPKHCKEKETETILKCGTSMGTVSVCSSSVLGGRSTDGVSLYQSPPIVLSSVVLDTRDLKEPTVKIDFSSLISFRTCGDDNYFLHLVFKLSKVCDEGHPVPLGTWTFEQIHHEDESLTSTNGGEYVQETDPFCFSWCECEECPGCCRYIVELVDQQCYNIVFAVISNISMSALAVGEKKVY